MKILMIGLGSIGQRHVRNLRQLLGADLELIAHRVRRISHVITPGMGVDALRDVEFEYDIRVYMDLDEALGQRPAAVFICNPNSMHVATAIACLKANCDLFIEKPVATSLDGVHELLSLAEGEFKDRIIMVGYQLRFHPCLKKLSEVIASGALGTLLAVRCVTGEYMPNWHPYEDYREAYAAKSEMGGGVILSQIHETDYLYSLFGLPKSVFALGGHWSELEISSEDTASILMEGTTSAGRTLPIHLHQDFLQSPQMKQCEVIGDRGKAVMDLVAVTVSVYGRDNPTPAVHEFPGFERNHLFLDQTSHFLDCIRNRHRPIVDLRDGLESVRIALAAKQSIATGKRVLLSQIGDFRA
jgi:predicted dehydrogenase